MVSLRNRCMLFSFSVLIIILFSVAVRFVTVQVFVKKLHIDNVVTQVILFDQEDLRKWDGKDEDEENKNDIVKINWAELYPFDESIKVPNKDRKVLLDNNNHGIIEKINTKIIKAEQKVANYTNKKVIGYDYYVDFANSYKQIINWNIANRKEYNGVVEIEDGQLAAFYEKTDMTEKINNITDFSVFCKENGAEFIYVSAPSKIGRNEKAYKELDFSNANGDEFIAGLKQNHVRYIDLRDNIEAEGLVTHNLFFRTDHHWLPETGLWATGIIAKYLNDNNIIKSDLSLLKPEKWDKEIYENWFLGSRGRKVTLARTTPDDISIFHPKFPVQYHLIISDKNVDNRGDFDIIYFDKELKEKDYYNKNPYGAYLYGDRPYISIDNANFINEKKVLIIRNSFAEVVNPFLALQFRHTDILDLRHFTGSVHSFIRQNKPDVVIVLYHIEQLGDDIKYDTHKNLWDFR